MLLLCLCIVLVLLPTLVTRHGDISNSWLTFVVGNTRTLLGRTPEARERLGRAELSLDTLTFLLSNPSTS